METVPSSDPHLPKSSQSGRLAWLPIPILLSAIIAARMVGRPEIYEARALLFALSFTFSTLVSLATLYLVGRSFLASGAPGLLWLECGVVLWCLAGTVGDAISHGDANINVTIFNVSIMLAGICHLAAAIFTVRPQRELRMKPVWLGVGCGCTVAILGLVAQAALSGWLPLFFIQGQGGTLVRYLVLTAAILTFILSAGVLYNNQREVRLPFTSWYAPALLLLATGLFGIMIQTLLGSMVNWLSRMTQWLGGLYLLIAALASLRESHLPLLPLGSRSNQVSYRAAVAVTVILVATAIRLAFLSALGMKAPYILYYPAVMFAALYGGLPTGLLATALSAITTAYFWIKPVGQFSIADPNDWLPLMLFLLSGTLMSWVADSMLRARASAATAEMQLQLATEREVVATKMREDEERLRLVLKASSMGTFELDLLTGKTQWNSTMYELLGVEAATTQPAPETFFRYVHPQDVTTLRQCWEKALHEGRLDAEFRIVRADGEERWLAGKGDFVFENKGAEDLPHTQRKALRFLGINFDITSRKRAEEAIRASEEQLRSLADSMPNLAWWANSDGYLTWYNKRWYEYTGTTPEEMEGWGWQSVHDPEALPKVMARWQASIASGAPFDMTFPLRGANGIFRQFLTRVIPLKDSAGRVLQWFGTNTDVDELEQRVAERTKELAASIAQLQRESHEREWAEKKLQEETAVRLQATESLRQKERLLIQQSRQAAMGEMIGNIAHQWRQPLNSLGIVVQQLLLFYDLGEFNRELLQKNVTIAKELIKNMSTTIDDFRNFFRPDKEKFEFKVTEAVAGTLSLIEDSFKSQNIAVEVEAKDDPAIFGYRNEYGQVLLNLLNNARDAIAERQPPDPRVTITITAAENRALVAVADNAGGIPAEIMDKIFDPYFSTKGPQQGTGVGLFMSKTIIEKNMGGKLSARNTATGAEFSIEV